MDKHMYLFLNHLDAPKRYFSLTIDEAFIVILGLSLVILTKQKILITLISFGLFSSLRFLKPGKNPKELLVLAYWHLPYAFTQFFLTKLPPSHQRIWTA